MRKILILAANPKDTTRLRLGEEVRDISEGLKRASCRDEFELVQRWAVRPRDLQRAMLEELPQIVHFSGHGSEGKGLYFLHNDGNSQLVTGQALASLFRLIGQESPINCVLLNSCYSQIQAEAIVKHVPYLIGMNDSVGDRSAIEFAVGFYDALGNGKSVEFAFELGKVAMELNGSGDYDAPMLLKGPRQAKVSINPASDQEMVGNGLLQQAQLRIETTSVFPKTYEPKLKQYSFPSTVNWLSTKTKFLECLAPCYDDVIERILKDRVNKNFTTLEFEVFELAFTYCRLYLARKSLIYSPKFKGFSDKDFLEAMRQLSQSKEKLRVDRAKLSSLIKTHRMAKLVSRME